MNKILNYLILAFLFLLPWQTRWIYSPANLNGTFWEYGTLCLYGTEILMWLIILLFAIDKFTKKEFWQKITDKKFFKAGWPRLAVSIAILVFFVFLIWHSLNWEVSYQFVLRVLGGFCLFVVILSTCHPERSEGSLKDGERDSSAWLGMTVVLWLSGVAQGLLALWQFFTQHIGADKWLGLAEQNARQLGAGVIEFGDERWLRAYGSFGWPNSLGIYLAVMLIIGLWLYLQLSFLRPPSPKAMAVEKRQESTVAKIRILIMIGQLVILSGLILSFSRGAWLAAAAGILCLAVVIARSRATKQSQLIELTKHILYYSIVFLLFFIALKPLFLTRVDATERLEQKSVAERQTQISEWKNIFAKNWLFGVGPGAYTQALYNENHNKPAWQYQPVHNIYLLMLAELGVIGFVLYLSLLVFLVIKNRKYNTFFPLLAALVVAGMFDHWLWSMYTGLLLCWIVFGIGFKQISR